MLLSFITGALMLELSLRAVSQEPCQVRSGAALCFMQATGNRVFSSPGGSFYRA